MAFQVEAIVKQETTNVGQQRLRLHVPSARPESPRVVVGEDEDDVADGEDTVRDAAGGRGVRAVGGTGSKVPEGKVRGKGLLNRVDSKP